MCSHNTVMKDGVSCRDSVPMVIPGYWNVVEVLWSWLEEDPRATQLCIDLWPVGTSLAMSCLSGGWFLTLNLSLCLFIIWLFLDIAPRPLIHFCLFCGFAIFVPPFLAVLPHVQPFTAQPRSPQLASFPLCSRCAQMDKGTNLASCSTRIQRE